jgi:hypothetical protein
MCGRKNSPIWARRSEGWGGDRALGRMSLESCLHAVLSSSMASSGEHRAFVVKEFSSAPFTSTSRSVDVIPFGNFTNGHSTAPRLLCHF